MIKQICNGWFEVQDAAGARAWFRTATECALWLLTEDVRIKQFRGIIYLTPETG